MIDVLAKSLLSSDEKQKLRMLCKLWLNDPNTRKDPNNYDTYGLPILRMNVIENYTGIIEGFSEKGEEDSETHIDKLVSNVDVNIEHEDNNSEEGLHHSTSESEVNIKERYVSYNDNDNNKQVYSITPMGDSLFNKRTPLSESAMELANLEKNQNKCLLGSEACGTLCSGYTTNPCNLVAPIPGPQWQPQSASTVENRISNGQFVPSRCPQGGQALRVAPNCQNIPLNSPQNPTNVQCVTQPTRNQ